MAETVLAGSHDWVQDRYNSYEHHTIFFDIKVTGEGQDRERSFDVWASYAEIENLVKDGYLVRESLIQGAAARRAGRSRGGRVRGDRWESITRAGLDSTLSV